MRIALLGVGLIGGSIGLAARRHVAGAEVVGYDPEPLDTALELGTIDRAAGSVAEALEGADAAFLCAPVGALPSLLQEALAAAPPHCVISDVGSVKRPLLGNEDERFVGGHPIAGAETSGVEHARAELFEGAPWYLTPGTRASGILYERLHRLIASFGAHPVAIDAETHDRLLAGVSHLPHVVANVLVSQAAGLLSDEGEALPRVGPSFRDATRVAGANSRIWTDIYAANAAAIAAEVEETARRLGEAAGLLRSGDRAAIAAWNEAARADRQRLMEADLAAEEVRELRLSVPNRPGIVAQVALALGKAGVNILDMALAPAPDMRSGAMTLWVDGAGAAERAEALVEELGFPVARGE